MLAIETTASIDDRRLVMQDAALPSHAERARVILSGSPESDWEALS